jgi:hypothetical protein
MAEEKDDMFEKTGNLSPKDIRGWVQSQIECINKASELRIKELTDLDTAYTEGKISPKEATRRSSEYANRWGEALPGVVSPRGMTDAEILAAIDETHRDDFPEGSVARAERVRRKRKRDTPDKTR